MGQIGTFMPIRFKKRDAPMPRQTATRPALISPPCPLPRWTWLSRRSSVAASKPKCVETPYFSTNIFNKTEQHLCGSPTASSGRSEEHTSELQSLMRISYAVFCLKKKKHNRY